MKKTYLDAEQTAEALLEALGKELGEARANFCEALMDPDREDPPMFMDEGYWKFIEEYEVEDFESWKAARSSETDAAETFKEVTVEKKGHGSGKSRRRLVLILVAVLIFVMGVFAVAADGVKLKKSTMHMSETANESTKITDIDKTKFDVEDFRVTYVPEGYELVEDEVQHGFVREIKARDSSGVGLRVHISKTNHFGANVDNEAANRKVVLVNDKQAYLFDDGEVAFIVWQMGDCTIDVSGSLPEEELIQIASHIYVK